MYKKGLRSMPRAIKKEVFKRNLYIPSEEDLIPISESFFWSKDEGSIVKELSQIHGLPSFWLVSSRRREDLLFIVFECSLTEECEEQIQHCFYYASNLYALSRSPYYGIY